MYELIKSKGEMTSAYYKSNLYILYFNVIPLGLLLQTFIKTTNCFELKIYYIQYLIYFNSVYLHWACSHFTIVIWLPNVNWFSSCYPLLFTIWTSLLLAYANAYLYHFLKYMSVFHILTINSYPLHTFNMHITY